MDKKQQGQCVLNYLHDVRKVAKTKKDVQDLIDHYTVTGRLDRIDPLVEKRDRIERRYLSSARDVISNAIGYGGGILELVYVDAEEWEDAASDSLVSTSHAYRLARQAREELYDFIPDAYKR